MAVLPTACHINSIMEVYEQMKLLEVDDDKCKIPGHGNDVLDMYCEPCEEVVCSHCRISVKHENHRDKIRLVSECFVIHREEMSREAISIKNTAEVIDKAIPELISRENEVSSMGEVIKREIHTHAQRIVDLVKESERSLVEEVERAVNQKVQMLTKQREEAETDVNQLTFCAELVDDVCKLDQLYIMKEKKSLIKHMQFLNRTVEPAVYKPIDEGKMTFVANDELVEQFRIIDLGEFKCESFSHVSLLHRDRCYFKKESTTELILKGNNGLPYPVPSSLISCKLFSSKDNTNFTFCNVSEVQPGRYKITFFPQHRGVNLLSVCVGGMEIFGSPFLLNTTISPQLRGSPVRTIRNVSKPWGVAVTDEHIMVAEYGSNKISIFNTSGKFVRSFGCRGTKTGQFVNPRGVSFTDKGYVLVTDENTIQKLKFGNEHSSREKMNISLYLKHPKGIAIHPETREVYVVEGDSHSIKILNENMVLRETFGKEGSSPVNPYSVAFDHEGYFYVVDRDNDKIKKFSSSKRFILEFGSSGNSPGQLKNPTSLAIDKNNLVYVTERGNHRVSIFDTDGIFIHCFGKKGHGAGDFDQPCGIAVDSLGNIYVSDRCNNRIVVL